MKFRIMKLAAFAVFTLTVIFSMTNREVKADNIRTTYIKSHIADLTASGSAVVSGGAVETTSSGAINVTSPAITTTPPAVTSPGGIQSEDEENNTTGVEVFDEFSVGGIFYTVTGIKAGKVYVGVSGVVNDRATTVFIPKKIKYKSNEMTVTSIENDGFSYMDRLRKVVVGANITYIGEDAFKEAIKFDRLVIKSNTLKKVGKNIFKGAGKKLIIEVSKKSLGNYKKLFRNKGVKIKEVRTIAK